MALTGSATGFVLTQDEVVMMVVETASKTVADEIEKMLIDSLN